MDLGVAAEPGCASAPPGRPLRVLVAGSTGAVGQALVPLLVARGHVVAGMARHPSSRREGGAVPIAVDALDREAVLSAVAAFGPEVVVHQLTSLPRSSSLRRFDRDFRRTNLLRTAGTDNLFEAARLAGARRLVAQSFCGWPYARIGGPVKDEADPFDPHPTAQFAPTLAALERLEATVRDSTDIEGTVLRYGSFYGPRTHLAPGSHLAEQVRRGRLPIVGDGGGVWSFIHIEDVATATLAAVEGGARGVYNVVDDDPAPVATWLPALARAMAAPPPRHLPAWLARLVLPEHVRMLMTEVRGGSNELFKRSFGWRPRYRSWRDGFRSVFGEPD